MAKFAPPERLNRKLRRVVKDARILEAVAAVPRELFVPPDLRSRAYHNVPLPIGAGQTISQPLVVARMCQLLAVRPDDRVLDVGTGSGYHAAVLAQLARHVWTIERHAELAAQARSNLEEAGVENVSVLVGDGSRGHPPEAPYDAINVAAAARGAVPAELIDQLTEGGRLVAPVEDGWQRLMLIQMTSEGPEVSHHEQVRFVPLVEDG